MLQDQAAQTGITSDAHAELTDKMLDLATEIANLKLISSDYADQLAAEEATKKALTDQTSDFFKVLGQEADIRSKIFQTEQAISNDRSEALSKEALDAMATATKIGDIEAKAGTKRAEIEQTTQDNISKIMRDAGRSEFDDVASRDAEKFRTDAQHEADALTDQAKNLSKQEQQLATSVAEQEATEKASLAARNAATEAGLNKRLIIEQQAEAQLKVDLLNTTTSQEAISHATAAT